MDLALNNLKRVDMPLNKETKSNRNASCQTEHFPVSFNFSHIGAFKNQPGIYNMLTLSTAVGRSPHTNKGELGRSPHTNKGELGMTLNWVWC